MTLGGFIPWWHRSMWGHFQDWHKQNDGTWRISCGCGKTWAT